MTDDDAELVALIDNELDEDRKSALLARLETDERLRERYEALRETGAPIAAAFDALLGQAPIERLRAGLPADAARAGRRDGSRASPCANSRPALSSASWSRARRRGRR